MSMMSSVGRNGGAEVVAFLYGWRVYPPRCKFNFVRDVHLTLILDFH